MDTKVVSVDSRIRGYELTAGVLWLETPEHVNEVARLAYYPRVRITVELLDDAEPFSNAQLCRQYQVQYMSRRGRWESYHINWISSFLEVKHWAEHAESVYGYRTRIVSRLVSEVEEIK